MAAAAKSQVLKTTSYADALNTGRKKSFGDGSDPSYGANIKAVFPKIDFLPNPPELQVKPEGKRVVVSPSTVEEAKLITPFKWALRGSFLRRRPSIKAIDAEIKKIMKPENPIQVASTSETEVLIRCLSEKDFIKILSRNSLRIGETQMRIFRWCPTKAPNRSLAAIWFSIKSLPLHLSSPACLRKMLQPWGNLLAVHEDVKYLTRPEEAVVCIEVNFSQQWPSELIIESQFGTFVSPVKALYIPKWCSRCGLMGHVLEDCRKKKMVCSYCNKLGHEASNCRTFLSKGKKHEQPQNDAGNRNRSFCFQCKKVGHEDSCCPLRRDDNNSGKTNAEKWVKIPFSRSRKNAEAKNKGKVTKTATMEEIGGGVDESQAQQNKQDGIYRENGECSNGQRLEVEATDASGNMENYDSCASAQEDWETVSRKYTTHDGEGSKCDIDPTSPAVSAPQVSAKKSKYGPLQWSSFAGDLHLNYKVWGALEDEETQPERKAVPEKRNFEKRLVCSRAPKDSHFRCGKCSIAVVPHKRSICKICAFQEPKKFKRKKSNISPPRYEAKSEEDFFNKTNDAQWEVNSKRDFQKRAEKNLHGTNRDAGKVEENSPPKMRWGDMTSDEEDLAEERENQHDKPNELGKKIKSRISSTEENEPRRTRSGRDVGHFTEGKKEQWIEGIRLLKVKRYDQRHNTKWLQWEVAPEMKISRREKKRLEDLAQRNEEFN